MISATRITSSNKDAKPRGGHPAKSSIPRDLNYKVHFIHWRNNLYKTWIYHSLQLMLETSLYVKQGIGKTPTIFQN